MNPPPPFFPSPGQVGSMGYVPVPKQPRRWDGFMNPFYSRQRTALSHARALHGGLTENQLKEVGIGKGKDEVTFVQEMNALNAGMYVGKPFHSGDIFQARSPGPTPVPPGPNPGVAHRARRGVLASRALLAAFPQGGGGGG